LIKHDFVYQRGETMRFPVCLLTAFLLLGCRTTKEDDTRHFAKADKSNDGLAGVSVKQKPEPKPGEPLPPLIPEAASPIESGAFYRICMAKDQLTSEQSLTLKAMLAATHQSNCVEAERWLRDQRHASLMIESEELVDLKSLSLLQSYPHIRNVYILVARGVELVCPLVSPQTCHFKQPEF
jgi:hypothetical protein